jgi:hypothetical protein
MKLFMETYAKLKGGWYGMISAEICFCSLSFTAFAVGFGKVFFARCGTNAVLSIYH